MRHGFIKAAAVTPDLKVADPVYNAGQICVKLREAYERRAKIIVFPELCITGYTCQDLFLQELLLQEALAAQEAGADYIGCGAVFGSSTKTDATVLPYEELKAICRAVEIPVVAIGGIHRGNVKKLAGSGIDGIAVISALFAGEDKGAAAKELLGAWEGENEDSIDHCRE